MPNFEAFRGDSHRGNLVISIVGKVGFPPLSFARDGRLVKEACYRYNPSAHNLNHRAKD
ncbi:MAG: hypothetical protein H7Z16_08270 [Pyrinomonadaceae bacterium]|nr:hypothetical protein [Pyrinomonadaceae bacterium]